MKREKEMYCNAWQLMSQLEEVSKFLEVYTYTIFILDSDS